jgi:hypothetical protein
MNLAVIFFLCAFCSGPPTPEAARMQSSPQTAPDVKPVDSSTPAKKPAPAKRKRPSTAKSTAPCSVSATNKTPSTPSPSNPAEANGSAPTGVSPGADPPPCVPTRVVVRNGGTSDGTVQLNGGNSSGEEASRRAGTNRLLASTDDELQKIGALSLDSSQQETVKQIRQYMAQARASLAVGDVDLAHNLAVKAHLLADELLKPRT